jgi:FAD/FMN-containing dehydrogenase/Fe-S oxidoreductase
MLYSTDASIYQVTPIGVVVPADDVDVRTLLEYCHARRIPVLPRGGGTSLAGQCTNHAVVCDLSPTYRRVLGFDETNRTLHVQAGLSIEQVNAWLREKGANLFFAPDPATVAQAAIGGVIGNNAAGARSIRYGRTSENIAGIEVMLASGEQLWLEPGAGRRSPAARRLAEQVIEIVSRNAEEIRKRYPKLNRRNAGYGLDSILEQIDAGKTADDLDLSYLICGSEGTLAVVTSAKLKLSNLPRNKGLAILSFPDLESSVNAVAPILETGAIAVELLDDEVLTAAAGNNECRNYLNLLEPIDGGLPRAVLYVEYQNETDTDEIAAGFERLRRLFPNQPARYFTDAPSMVRAWALRKAGEPLLHGIGGHRKPHGFVEDNSIPIASLPRFIREFKAIVAAHGTRAAYYAHASVGVLHVRPMLDLHDEADRDRLRSIAVQVAELTRGCGGYVSGEHGDGRARGPLLASFFGPEITQAFHDVKTLFDPHFILNPGNIVDAGSVESLTETLRVKPAADVIRVPEITTYFDFSDQEGFQGALEMCNGAGVCRKTAGGTMCPSFRGTMDERHSTRGRGNALRLAISGQLRRDSSGKPNFDDAETLQTLDLCLSCKACKSECPSNVDIARLKAEYLSQKYDHTGVPLGAKVFGRVRTLNRLGAMAPGLTNWVNSFLPVRAMLNRTLKLSPKRSLPTFHRSLFRWFEQRARAVQSGQKVVLFPDCFVTYNEPNIGMAAIELLEKLGYEVLLPDAGCCGRSMISTGLLGEAINSIDAGIDRLRTFIDDPDVRAIVVAEPSCLSAIKDDWLQLKVRSPLELRRKLAEKSFLIEEFVDRFWDAHPIIPLISTQSDGPPVILHGHCHQKALWGDETSAAAIRRVAGSRLTVLPSGCCGMAGSFGYLERQYDLSMKIGELSVFPPLRAAPADAVVIAPGTSCRHQIHDGASRHAVHPVEFLASAISRQTTATEKALK